MSIIGSLLDNVAARVVATTAPTAIGGIVRFAQISHEGAWSGAALLDLKSPTRRFVVELTGDRGRSLALVRGLGQMAPVRQVVLVVVAYRQGADAFGLVKAIAEDVEALALEMTRADSDRYGESTTGIWQRTVDGYSVEWAPGTGGVCLVRLPVVCDYLP